MKKSVKNNDSVAPASVSTGRERSRSEEKKDANGVKTSSSRRKSVPKTSRSRKADLDVQVEEKAGVDEENKTSSVKKTRKSTGKKSTSAGPKAVKKASRKSIGSSKGAKESASDRQTLLFDLEPQETETNSAAVSESAGGNWEEIQARIASVPLSDKELARRKAHEEEKSDDGSRDVENVYSGPLPKWDSGWLVVQGARKHNLKSIDVPIPLSAFSVVTGVSGSGKSSLVEDVLFTTLSRTLNRSNNQNCGCDGVWGVDQIKSVVHVDQSPIGQTPSSNPATYTGLFDLIRSLYARLPESKVRGYSPRQFSFNVPGGRCEKCEGTGLIKVEMHFLADIWITCDACGGKRYDAETLQVKYRDKSISDALETTCADALKLFDQSPAICRILQTLCDVGLDYLPLGQSAPTLSGGEAQRVKLAAELSRIDSGSTLYVLDEPTTGLHFEDIRKLLDVLHRLVDLGNTVVVVEHNLDVIKNADWILEIGPEAGLEGGNLVFAGTPEQLLEYTAKRNSSEKNRKSMLRSYTGESLFPVFERGVFYERPTLNVNQYWDSVKKATEASESLVPSSDSEFSLPPWEIDGRRWHTELRTTRSGSPCHWDSNILTSVVDRLMETANGLSVEWGNRTIVEVGATNRSGAWFMRATTNDEWLLKLRFRTAKNSFNRDLLTRKLALKPLNDMDEIPLYGTQPRVRVETVGAWQEVELRAFSLDEIDQPEFWSFLDLAVERFNQQIAQAKENEPDLTPWRTKGREWHFSQQGFYGEAQTPQWSTELLEQILDAVQNTDPTGTVDWYQKISVLFNASKAGSSWAQVYTKNVDFICVQVKVAKNSVSARAFSDLGFGQEFDTSNPQFDTIYLRYRSMEDYDAELLSDFLNRAFSVRAE